MGNLDYCPAANGMIAWDCNDLWALQIELYRLTALSVCFVKPAVKDINNASCSGFELQCYVVQWVSFQSNSTTIACKRAHNKILGAFLRIDGSTACNADSCNILKYILKKRVRTADLWWNVSDDTVALLTLRNGPFWGSLKVQSTAMSTMSLMRMRNVSRIFCSKPRSSSLSASSRMSHFSSFTWKARVFSRWSSRRPGEATTTESPFRSRAFSLALFSPPVIAPHTCMHATQSMLECRCLDGADKYSRS